MCDSVLGNKFNTTNQAGKKIILTPSLFMRLLEWSKEDAKDDIALHQVFEKVMAFTDGTNPVGIECYDALVKDACGSSLSEDETEVCDYDNGYGYDVCDYCVNPEDVECVAQSPFENIVDCPEGMTMTINCDNGEVCDDTECVAQPCAYDDSEIEEIIKLGQI